MTNFVSLTCPSCGAKLQINASIERFACAHCGNEHVIKRGDGIVTLEPVIVKLKNIQKGTDKTASELAIKRIKEELRPLEERLLELIENELFREVSLMKALMGKDSPYGWRLCNSFWELEEEIRGQKIGWKSFDNSVDIKKLSECSIQELHDATDFAVRKYKKSKNITDGIIEFSNELISLKEQIEPRKEQLRKHEKIVNI